MTPDEFSRWQDAQDERFDLVDGTPRPRRRLAAGTNTQHDRLKVNAIVALHRSLTGSPCRSHTGAVVIRTGAATLQRPDLTVACGFLDPDAREIGEPRLVVEILSSATVTIDLIVKLEEYKRHPTLRYILLLETVAPVALLYRREAEGWQPELVEGLDAVIALPEIDAKLALAEVYDGLAFAPRITDATR